MVERRRIKSGSVTWQKVDDEVVVLDLAGSVYLSLNGSGALLWGKMAEDIDVGATVEALVSTLESTYGISHDVAAGDVAAFIDQGLESGIME